MRHEIEFWISKDEDASWISKDEDAQEGEFVDIWSNRPKRIYGDEDQLMTCKGADWFDGDYHAEMSVAIAGMCELLDIDLASLVEPGDYRCIRITANVGVVE